MVTSPNKTLNARTIATTSADAVFDIRAFAWECFGRFSTFTRDISMIAIQDGGSIRPKMGDILGGNVVKRWDPTQCAVRALRG